MSIVSLYLLVSSFRLLNLEELDSYNSRYIGRLGV